MLVKCMAFFIVALILICIALRTKYGDLFDRNTRLINAYNSMMDRCDEKEKELRRIRKNDDVREWIPATLTPANEREVEVLCEGRALINSDEHYRCTGRAIYEDGSLLRSESLFIWDGWSSEDEEDAGYTPPGWFAYSEMTEAIELIDCYDVIAWRPIPNPPETI